MTDQELFQEVERLERRVQGACLDTRLEVQPQFSRIMDRIRERGVRLPSRLRRLDAALCEDAAEAYFDNMPV